MPYVMILKERELGGWNRYLLSRALDTREEAIKMGDFWKKMEGNEPDIVTLYIPKEEYNKWKKNVEKASGTYTQKEDVNQFLEKNRKAVKSINITGLNLSLFLQNLHAITPALTHMRRTISSKISPVWMHKTESPLTTEEAKMEIEKAKTKESDILYFRGEDTYYFGIVKAKMLLITITLKNGIQQLNATGYTEKHGIEGIYKAIASTRLNTTIHLETSGKPCFLLHPTLFPADVKPNTKFSRKDTCLSYSVLISESGRSYTIGKNVLGKGDNGKVKIGQTKNGELVTIKRMKNTLEYLHPDNEKISLLRRGIFAEYCRTDRKLYLIKRYEHGCSTIPKEIDFALQIRLAFSLALELFCYHQAHCHGDLDHRNILFDSETRTLILIDGGTTINSHAPFAAPEIRRLKGIAIPADMVRLADIYSLGIWIQQWFGFSATSLNTTLSSHLLPLYDLHVKMINPNPKERPSLRNVIDLLQSYYQKTEHKPLKPTLYSKPSFIVLHESLQQLAKSSHLFAEFKAPLNVADAKAVCCIKPIDKGEDMGASIFMVERIIENPKRIGHYATDILGLLIDYAGKIIVMNEDGTDATKHYRFSIQSQKLILENSDENPDICAGHLAKSVLELAVKGIPTLTLERKEPLPEKDKLFSSPRM